MKGKLIDIIRNTGSTIVIRGLFGITRIFLLLLIAKKFGPEGFGRLSLVLSLVEIVRVFADFGVDIVTIRRFSLNRLLSERLLGNTLALKLLTATAGYIISIITFWLIYHSTEGLKLLLIVGTSLYTSLLVNAFVSHFQANLKMSSIIISSLASSILYISLTVIGLYTGWSLAYLCAIIPMSEVINLLIIARVYSGAFKIRLRLDRKIVLSLLKESLPVAIGGIAVVVYSRLDNLMIGWFLGDRSVGEYAASFRLTEPFVLIFSSLSLSIFASMSRFGKSPDSTDTKQTIFKVVATVSGLSLIAAILLALFSKRIMGLISHDYAASVIVLQILSCSIVFKAVNTQLTAFINSRGRYSLITKIAFTNLIINIALNLLMIPNYGIMGAAVAVVITEGINTLVQCGFVFYLFNFSFGRFWSRWVSASSRR